MKEYKHPYIGAGVVVEEKGRILLGVRARDPFKGKYEYPSGFVNYGERVEDAAVREFMEETGFKVKLTGIVGVYSDKNRDPRVHSAYVLFAGKIVGGRKKLSAEVRRLEWVDARSLRKSDWCFDYHKSFHDYLKWKKGKGAYWSSRR
ncbi:MAG TPA: NUDIX hydrolase [archaeon]|nr:NUDIX hydrolase [archaeon]HLD80615.1 NUDIX hydrolase [archaeon]